MLNFSSKVINGSCFVVKSLVHVFCSMCFSVSDSTACYDCAISVVRVTQVVCVTVSATIFYTCCPPYARQYRLNVYAGALNYSFIHSFILFAVVLGAA